MSYDHDIARTAGSRNVWVRMATALLPALALLSAERGDGAVGVAAVRRVEDAVVGSGSDRARASTSASSASGKYKVTLTDLGAQLQAPGQRRSDKVQLVITRNSTVVAVLDGNGERRAGLAHRHDGVRCDARQVRRACRRHPGAEPGLGPGRREDREHGARRRPRCSISPARWRRPRRRRPTSAPTRSSSNVPADGAYELTLTDLSFPQAGSLKTASGYLFQAGSPALAACLNLTCRWRRCAPDGDGDSHGGHVSRSLPAVTLADDKDGALFSVSIKSVADGTLLYTSHRRARRGQAHQRHLVPARHRPVHAEPQGSGVSLQADPSDGDRHAQRASRSRSRTP